jgi:hypothetical protein
MALEVPASLRRRVEGEAHPGASIHYWAFYEEDETLKLRFYAWEW